MNQPIQTTSTAVARREVDTTILVPTTIGGFYDFAADYWKAGLVPSSYKSMEQVAIAMIKGHEFGMLPAQSVDAFYVINGRACPWGRALRGLVQSSGTLEGELDGVIESFDEFSYMCTEANPYEAGSLDYVLAVELQRALCRRQARIKGKNPGAAYLCGYSVVKKQGQAPKAYLFDSFDATKAGLLTKSGPWSQMPGRMCMHRAATFIRSDVFSDRLTGLDMTAEEAMDVLPIDLGTQPAPPPRPPAAAPTEVLRDLASRRAEPQVKPLTREAVEHGIAEAERAGYPAESIEKMKVQRDQMFPAPAAARPEVVDAVATPTESTVVAEPEPPPAPASTGSILDGIAGKGLSGTEVLRKVCLKLKAAGLDAEAVGALSKAAALKVCGEVKASKDMTVAERGLVGVKIVELYEDEQARLKAEAEAEAAVDEDRRRRSAAAEDPLDF